MKAANCIAEIDDLLAADIERPSEIVSEELRAIGFHSFPRDAEALLKGIADRLSQ